MSETTFNQKSTAAFAPVAKPFSYTLNLHISFTLITLGIYFLVWAVAKPDSWIAQAMFAEDHLGEWLQFACCIGVTYVAFKTAIPCKTAWLKAVLYIGGVGMFFVGGEEISWGQRLFGFGSDFFLVHNNQGETNFHNFLPLESNILPYYVAAFMIGIVMNGVGYKLTRKNLQWPFMDTFISAAIMATFYFALPMEKHIFFYEYTELWIYASILIFNLRLRKSILA